MCKKCFRIFILSIFIAFCMPIIACAAPSEIEDNIQEREASFLAYFDLDDAAISHIFDIEQEDLDDESEVEAVEEDINTFTNLKLSKGFRQIKTKDDDYEVKGYFQTAPTFYEDKELLGEGEEEAVVGVIVYKETEEDGFQVTFVSERQTIGLSGLYKETVEFNHIGENYIMVAVKKDGIVELKYYCIRRKDGDTKEFLENIDIELDADQQDDEDTDNVFEFFKDLIDDEDNNEEQIYKIIK